MKKYNLLMLLILYGNINSESHVALITMPKCGTHLVEKCIKLITRKNSKHWNIQKVNWETQFFLAHLPYLEAYGCKIITILRDPRDRIISSIVYYKRHHLLRDKNKDLKLILTEVINNPHNGLKNNFNSNEYYGCSTMELYYNRYFVSLSKLPNCYVTYFEKLVGEKGGGSREDQLEEIKKIASHIGVALSPERIEEIADNLFGNTDTFEKGQIGNWREWFSEEQKKMFKKKSGNLLITLGYEKNLEW